MAETQEAAEKAIIDHHRVAGLSLSPVMERLGFTTEVEIDVSFKRQIIDIICVRRAKVVDPPLPPIYWQVFDELNDHNLMSFKSYSESFNGHALEEFYGHLTNYCKVKGVKRAQVNLYVLTNHYPRDLLDPLVKAGQVTTVGTNGVYDLRISTLKRVRFIVCSQTDNPILALFSTNIERIQSAYTTLQNEPELFGKVSVYWQQILRHIDEEIKNMYTKEDFLRDYPPTEDSPFLFPWQVEALKAQTAKQSLQQGIEQGISQKNRAIVHAMHDKGFDLAVIADITNLTAAQVQGLLAEHDPNDTSEAGDAAQAI